MGRPKRGLEQGGKNLPFQMSLAKRNNSSVSLEVARTCRSLLGGNGISATLGARSAWLIRPALLFLLP